MYRWVARLKHSKARERSLRLVRQRQEVRNGALIQFNARGVNGAAMEGLEGPVLEVPIDGLRFVELPGLELADVKRAYDLGHSSIACDRCCAEHVPFPQGKSDGASRLGLGAATNPRLQTLLRTA